MKPALKGVIGALLAAALPVVANARVVLYEDFSGGAVPSSFSVYGPAETVSVEQVEGNSVLKIQNSSSVSVGVPSWTDYSVQARVFVYDGSYWMYSAGVYLRGQGDLSSSYTANGISWSTRPGFLEAQKWTIGPGWQIVLQDPAHGFPPGEWHTLKIKAKGTHFDFFVDGALVQTYDDPAAPLTGVVGLGNWGAGAYYDDLVVDVEEQPGVLVSEDFEYGSSGVHPLWTIAGQSGAASSVVALDGGHVLSMNGSAAATIGDPAWTDYTAEADVRVFDSWYWAYAAGLLFRSQQPAQPSWDLMDTYVWQGRPWGMQLEQWTSTRSWSWLSQPGGAALTDGGWHRLKVIASGPSQRLFLDGAEIASVYDANSLSGFVGFRAYGVGAYYDNLLVRVNDTAAPVTTATATTGRAGWIVAPAKVSLQAADAATPAASGMREVRFALDGAAETAVAGGAAEVTVLGDGAHALAFHAVDQDNNVEAVQTLTLAVDTTAPVVAVATSPASIAATGKAQTVTITGSAVDATSGMSQLTIKVTDAAGKLVAVPKAFGSAVSLVGVRGQTYTVTVVAFDKAGNQATATAVVPVL